MRPRRLALWMPVLWIWPALAQPPAPRFTPDITCVDLNQDILDKVATGKLAEAEAAASRALTSLESNHAPACLWLVQHNMAHVKALSGRYAEAEMLEEQALKIMDNFLSLDDPFRLRPLHLLWSVEIQQDKRGKARQTFRAMQSLRLEGPQDQVMFHSAAAAQLNVEGQLKEAEIEYSAALAAWRELGRGDSPDVAALLVAQGELQLRQGRFPEARKSLDRALSIVRVAQDALPMDFINVLRARAGLNVHQRKWQAAAEDQEFAISMADRETRLDTAQRKIMLDNFAYILRKAHRSRVARSIEARAKTIHAPGSTNAAVDVSELVDNRKALRK